MPHALEIGEGWKSYIVNLSIMLKRKHENGYENINTTHKFVASISLGNEMNFNLPGNNELCIRIKK